MSRLKAETVSIRTSNDVKQLLKMAADREHRSVASMIEVLILNYAHLHGLQVSEKASNNKSVPI
ncbi:hypothetical protein [Burkholderia cepacia]|uniref:hypothetical protein n=1 Tax=Burkholderia cepacia TaxID=292 RepID=UPI001589E5E8|nr:hypothetical protein [Burkholderia cepacia]